MTKQMITGKVRHYYPPTNKIIARMDDKKKATAGGLVIPDAAQEKQTYVTVIAVGAGINNIKPGDRLCFGGLYQMIMADGDDQGIVVLRYPEEIMYGFEDRMEEREETDEEHEERLAAERRKEQWAGGRLGVEGL